MGELSISIFSYKWGFPVPSLHSCSELPVSTPATLSSLHIHGMDALGAGLKMFALNGTVWNVLLSLQALFKIFFIIPFCIIIQMVCMINLYLTCN